MKHIAMKRLAKFHISFLILILAINANALPPERPKQPWIDSFYVDTTGELVAVSEVANALYRSVDGGLRWTKEPDDIKPLKKGTNSRLDAARQLCIPGTFGSRWTCIGLNGAVDAVDGNGNLYKCSANRLELSRDGGKRWAKTAAWSDPSGGLGTCGLVAAHGDSIYVLAVYVVGEEQTLYKSDDRGAHWIRVNDQATDAPIRDERILGLMLDKHGVLYATTGAVSDTQGWDNRIYTSKDGGRVWQRQTFGLPTEWRVFTLRRLLPDAIYFVAAGHQTPGHEGNLYRSTDGVSASKLNIDIEYGSWVDIQTGSDGSIYVVTGESIFRSRDLGKTWVKLSSEGISW